MRKSVSKWPAGIGRLLALSVLVCWSFRPVGGQLDGSFWWMNSNLLKQAEALRESKDVKAIVITKDSELDEVRVGGNSLVDSDSPDCICVPLGRCAGSGTKPTGRDGLCGTESVCCRRNQIVTIDATTTTPTTTTSATIGSTVSTTKLKPVDSLIFDSDGPSLSLPETASFKPIPPNESAHDPALLLELSNLLLSHSITDTFDASNNNALEIEPASTSGSNKEGNSEKTTIKPAEIIDVHSQCGIKRNHVTSRIYFQDEDDDVPKEPVFGMAEYAEFPWTVAVYHLIRNGTFVYHCGGALLNRKVIVTAAHCVSNNRLHPSRYVVHAGDWDRRHKQERLPHQERTVSRIVVHPNYYSGALFNDVALLFFDEPFNMTANVGPICLPSEANMSSYSNCVVTGWGGSPKQNRAQSVQQFSKLALFDQAHCEAKLRDQPSLGRKFKLHESFVCADVDATVDLCQGSGGSPLVCEKNGHYHLIGLVSWGIGCGDGIPAVLSNVSALSEWIRANVS